MDGANTWPLGNKRGLAELLELGGVMDGWMTLLKDEEKHWVSLSESGLQSEGAICEEPEDCIHCRSEAVLALARSLAASRALVAEKETALRNLAKWVRDPANPNLLSLTRNTRAVLALTEEGILKRLEA